MTSSVGHDQAAPCADLSVQYLLHTSFNWRSEYLCFYFQMSFVRVGKGPGGVPRKKKTVKKKAWDVSFLGTINDRVNID